ncbi:hypothetical protein FisN_14Hh164 [Fistulifera solaris]|uniref:XPG-I domain-containing protein n=1 Tax=Fistulifera solaris TaxID=1519565 RepID=A0A1Z5K8U7_FISSO|nr:hypothetical protein FisN_14Hh164 [Fistulifera solaris]|eukprot:GAX22541.1 hypothetical protein FisN_14Hh164 [Fistulifera solaris]
MGVTGGLQKILPNAAAFRKVDLRSFQNGIQHSTTTKEPTPLRIGVDICVWMVSADRRFGSQLGDDRHFSNHGRAELLNAVETAESERERLEKDLMYVNNCTDYIIRRLNALREQTNVEILVVFDGATPPGKQTEVTDRRNKQALYEQQRDEPVDMTGSREAEERRIKALRRAGASRHYAGVFTAVMEALRKERISFLVAPYESDGQLAFLSMKKYIDLIVTEDSDLICYGASPILFKLKDSPMLDGVFEGILVCKEDLAANQESVNLLDFSPVMLAVLFVAVGSDYSPKLDGVGIVTACKIVRKAFLSGHEDRLAMVFEGLFAAARKLSLTEEDKQVYRKKFMEALLSYRHPVIFDPVEKRCRVHGIGDDGEVSETEAELLTHVPYAELVNDVGRRERITGCIQPPSLSILIAEGYVCPRTKRTRKNMTIPRNVKAELIQLGIWKDYNNPKEADNERHDSSISSNQVSGIKRKSLHDPSSKPDDEDSSTDSEDFLDSQPFSTRPPTNG